jgi:spore maturation protein CgeB
MSPRLKIAFFGSSLVSAYWNGAATYYRGLLRALAALGHDVTFYEPDAFGRQEHRDIPDPPWARVVVYSSAKAEAALRALEDAKGADVIVKASGVGVFDGLLETAVADLRSPSRATVFWDVDAPATLERLFADAADPLRALLPQFDFVLTYGGGEPVAHAYRALGARACVAIYNALDPSTHHPAPPDPRFTGDLLFMGNRLPDRETRVREFFFEVARALPARSFLLGGSGWETRPVPNNTRQLGHVYTRDHNAANSTPLAVLNISRDRMARFGFSPATRFFEAAGAGACLITDAWEGVECFLEPGREVLVAKSGADVADQLARLTPSHAAEIGGAARRRLLASHTYAQRAAQVERVLCGAAQPTAAAAS